MFLANELRTVPAQAISLIHTSVGQTLSGDRHQTTTHRFHDGVVSSFIGGSCLSLHLITCASHFHDPAEACESEEYRTCHYCTNKELLFQLLLLCGGVRTNRYVSPVTFDA
ncbi:hypothetical protein D3C87_1663320 [compost metagenome]